jgi:acyl-CoA thioester hydrolase
VDATGCGATTYTLNGWTQLPASRTFSDAFTIPQSAIDQNGHVNNVACVQWMQDVAVRHYESIGGTNPMQAAGATWVVREHRIEYPLPAFAGEEIEVRTWVENIRKVRSLRRYEFVRKSDSQILVRGETEWVFVDAESGKPIAIPDEVIRVFSISKTDQPDAN